MVLYLSGIRYSALAFFFVIPREATCIIENKLDVSKQLDEVHMTHGPDGQLTLTPVLTLIN
jgi:hypothetical protein